MATQQTRPRWNWKVDSIAVPRSLVTNDPAAMQRFAAQSDTSVVIKPLTANLLYEDNTYKMGWTRKLSADDLADLRGVAATAHLVQDWVEKAWECRVVVVGDEVFAVSIHAGSEAARIDWRSDYPALSYEVINLPSGVEKALRAIMDEFGLVYGAFDLSVSNDGGSEVFWFLEINPGGQYGFLEAATGIPITDSLVRLLMKGIDA